MQSQTETIQGIPVMHVAGRFDRSDFETVDVQLEALLGQDPKHVVIDLAQVSFVDSYGLASLVRVMKHCRQRGGELILVGVPHTIQRILELTRLDRVFPIHPDIDTALMAVR